MRATNAYPRTRTEHPNGYEPAGLGMPQSAQHDRALDQQHFRPAFAVLKLQKQTNMNKYFLSVSEQAHNSSEQMDYALMSKRCELMTDGFTTIDGQLTERAFSGIENARISATPHRNTSFVLVVSDCFWALQHWLVPSGICTFWSNLAAAKLGNATRHNAEENTLCTMSERADRTAFDMLHAQLGYSDPTPNMIWPRNGSFLPICTQRRLHTTHIRTCIHTLQSLRHRVGARSDGCAPCSNRPHRPTNARVCHAHARGHIKSACVRSSGEDSGHFL